MQKSKALPSAYGGANFTPRNTQKSKTGLDIYFPFSTEYEKLQEVVLYLPGNEIHQISNPDKYLHLEKIDAKKLQKEINSIINFFKKNKIKVVLIEKIKNRKSPPNLFFARDLFWHGPNGILISRMGSSLRSEEEIFIQRTISFNDYPIHFHFHTPSTFEGADLLWLDTTTLLLGIGNRTNRHALNNLRNLFPKIKIISIKLPKKVQHLLGLIQLIDKEKVLLRTEIAPSNLKKLLNDKNFKTIEIPEINEVTNKQGMNIVVIEPNTIIMPNDCPGLENIYISHRVKVLAKFKITELRKAAGGIACLTGILKRSN